MKESAQEVFNIKNRYNGSSIFNPVVIKDFKGVGAISGGFSHLIDPFLRVPIGGVGVAYSNPFPWAQTSEDNSPSGRGQQIILKRDSIEQPPTPTMITPSILTRVQVILMNLFQDVTDKILELGRYRQT